MRKDITALVDTLKKSVVEISASDADTRDELLGKSMGEFQIALLSKLESVLGPEFEPLGKGLNHVAEFALALQLAADRVALAKIEVPEEISDQMDRFIDVGVTTLRSLVNGTGEMPDTDEDFAKAERAGELAKVETIDGEEYYVRTTLPETYRSYFTDPVDLLADHALLARDFQNQAIAIADSMAKAELLPEGIVTEFPELFEQELSKAFPNQEDDADGNADPTQDPGDDSGEVGASDDAPQNPIEMMVRLASIIVVVGGSLMQAGAGADQSDQSQPQASPDANADSMQDDGSPPPGPGPNMPPNMPSKMPPTEPKKKPFPAQLQRQEPTIGETPLEKILAGEIEVHPTIADALDELVALRKSAGENEKLTKAMGELDALKATVERLSKQPAAPKGALFQVNKSEDSNPGALAGDAIKAEANRISELAKLDPDAAARALVKSVHSAGGTPLIGA
jgi:hypothetical protein